MRTWHWLAASIVWCASCADAGDGDAGDTDAGDTDAGDTDAGDAGMSDAGRLGMLTPEELATAEAEEDIAALECSVFEPCGGDPTGTWNIEGLCLDDVISVATAGVQNCHDILTAYERTASGTMTFTPEGALEMDLMITGKQRLVLDDACSERLYRSAVSEDSCATYEEQLNGGAATHVSSCTFDGHACACEVEVNNSLVFTGSYVVSAIWIDDRSMLAPFCVDGDTFSIEYQFSNRRFALDFTRAESE
jgi:hypothetical protein